MSEPEKPDEPASQDFPPFPWREPQVEAAQLLAEDDLTDEEIAAKVGISRRQLTNWKQHPDFRKRIEEITARMGDAALRHGIARRNRRLRALDDRWRRMQQVIDERAVDPEMRAVPGGRTGLLVHNVKSVGKGDDFQVIDLYEVDVALLRELREHEKQAAQELGQWTERRDMTTGGKPFKVYIDVDIDRV